MYCVLSLQAFHDRHLTQGALPSALRRVMMTKFPDFDEYQLGKKNILLLISVTFSEHLCLNSKGNRRPFQWLPFILCDCKNVTCMSHVCHMYAKLVWLIDYWCFNFTFNCSHFWPISWWQVLIGGGNRFPGFDRKIHWSEHLKIETTNVFV